MQLVHRALEEGCRALQLGLDVIIDEFAGWALAANLVSKFKSVALSNVAESGDTMRNASCRSGLPIPEAFYHCKITDLKSCIHNTSNYLEPLIVDHDFLLRLLHKSKQPLAVVLQV